VELFSFFFVADAALKGPLFHGRGIPTLSQKARGHQRRTNGDSETQSISDRKSEAQGVTSPQMDFV
jgi:hypothetical protein